MSKFFLETFVLFGFLNFMTIITVLGTTLASSDITNPVPLNEETLAAGKKIYTHNCLPCHGEHGKGDGPAGQYLDPHPADYTGSAVTSKSDGFLFQRVSEGYNAMPEWADALTEEERWKVIHYIRTFASPAPVAGEAKEKGGKK